jgi:zinc transport system permease protein
VSFLTQLAESPFLQRALLAGLLASIAVGVIGSYVVVRRITYVAGSIAHCVLGGLGLARYLQVNHGWTWCAPRYGAIASALLAAIIIGWVSLRAKEREDTAIGALWAIGMAVGLVFIHKTHGYSQDLMAYLFGDILLVSSGDLWSILVLDALVVGIGILFYKQFLAVCFDEEFARLRGVRVELIYMLLLCLTALTVVVLVEVVGIVLVIALLTLPVAIAGQLARSLQQMMLLGMLVSVILTSGGLAISDAADLPAGATIILLAGTVYVFMLLVGGKRRRVAG